MKNDLVVAIHKDKAYATSRQKGHKSKWLDCIDNITEFCRMISIREKQLQAIINRSQKFNNPIDHTARCIAHGISNKYFKSIDDALLDVTDKLADFRKLKYNQYVVNWSEGEIAVFNAVIDIVNDWLKQNDFKDLFPRIIIKRHFDGPDKPEYVDISNTTITANQPIPQKQVYKIKFEDPLFEKMEAVEDTDFNKWDCHLPMSDKSRHRT